METEEEFCDVCGGSVAEELKAGREHLFRAGVSLEIPEDFPIPTCQECGERYLSADEMEALDAALEPKFVEYVKALLDRAKKRTGLSLRDLEAACAVTPTYLSQISSRGRTSGTLLRLLEEYARHPEDAWEHVPGKAEQQALKFLRSQQGAVFWMHVGKSIVVEEKISERPEALEQSSTLIRTKMVSATKQGWTPRTPGRGGAAA